MRENATKTTSLLLTPLLSATLVLGGMPGASRALAAPAAASEAATPSNPAAAPDAPATAPSYAPAAIPGVAAEPVEAAKDDKPQDDAAAAPREVSAAEIADARRHYAEQFAATAQDSLQYYEPSDALWAYSAALLRAAHRLNPQEPRYPRMLAEALIELRDVPGAIQALGEYRGNLQDRQEDDPVAQCRIIELYLGQMQTLQGVDAKGEPVGKIPYLKGIVYNKNNVPAEVKSYAAVLCIPLLIQRSRAEAVEMTRKAVELNPLSLKARQYEHDLIVAPGGGRLEEVQSLLAMVRCNPSQPQVLAAIGRHLAQEGLAEQSLEWFDWAGRVSQMGGGALEADALVEYVVQLFHAGRIKNADVLAQNLLQIDPTNIDTWFARLAMLRDAGQRVEYEQALDKAKETMLGRAVMIARATTPQGKQGGNPAARATPQAGRPATQPASGPADAPTPEEIAHSQDLLRETIERLNQPGARQDLRRDFTSAIADLAWLEIYFYRRPEAAVEWVNALRRLLPAGHQTVIRLEGWTLIDANPAAARARFASILDRDPLAGLGMVLLMSQVQAAPATQPAAGSATTGPAAATTRPATNPTTAPAAAPVRVAPAAAAPAPAPAAGQALTEADILARQLLEQYPTGVTSLLLHTAMRSRRTPLALRPSPNAAALKSLLSRFPKQWMDIIEKPENFYILSGEAIKKTHNLGETMLAGVKLQNRSNFDISVGPDGVIKPDLWFDAHVGAAADRLFPMSGYDRVAGLMVLRAKTDTTKNNSTQIVRINQGAMGMFLRTKPAASLGVLVTVTTNPVAIGEKVLPGPGGLRRLFNKPLIRSGQSVADEAQKEKIYKVLTDDKHLPSDEMLALDLLTAYVRSARVKGADGRVMSLEKEMLEQIEKARADRIPQVGGWATYEAAMLALPPGEGLKLAEELTRSPYWEVRTLASLAVGAFVSTPSGKEEAKQVAATLSADEDATIQELAKAQVKFLGGPAKVRKQFLPTTQPSAEPTPETTQPSEDSGTAGVPVGAAR